MMRIDEGDVLSERSRKSEGTASRQKNACWKGIADRIDGSAGYVVVIAGTLAEAGANWCFQRVEVDDAESCPEHGCRGRLKGCAETGLNVVQIPRIRESVAGAGILQASIQRQTSDRALQRVAACRAEVRSLSVIAFRKGRLVVVSKTEIDGESTCYTPIILNERRHIDLLQCIRSVDAVICRRSIAEQKRRHRIS